MGAGYNAFRGDMFAQVRRREFPSQWPPKCNGKHCSKGSESDIRRVLSSVLPNMLQNVLPSVIPSALREYVAEHVCEESSIVPGMRLNILPNVFPNAFSPVFSSIICFRVICPSYASKPCARAMFPFRTLFRNCDSQRNFQAVLPSYASEHVTARASKMGSRAVLLSYASEPCLRAMLRNAVSNILSSALGGSRIHLEETWRNKFTRMPPPSPLAPKHYASKPSKEGWRHECARISPNIASAMRNRSEKMATP